MTIKEEVVQALAEKAALLFHVDASKLDENTRFTEDLGAKSTNIVQFSAMLEDKYDIEVSYMELVKCKTFGDAGDYMEELLNQ